MTRDQKLGLLSGLTAASIWGGMYVVSKVVLDVIPPFALLSLRLVLGAAVLGLIAATKARIQLTLQQALSLVGVGLIGYGISLGFQLIGTKLSTAANGAVVTTATPAFVFIFSLLILGERLYFRRIVALVISTLGVLVVIDPRTASLTPELFWGNLSLAAAALSWALYSVLIRKVTRQVPIFSATLVAIIGGLVVSIPAAFLESDRAEWGTLTPGILAGILYLGIISTALAAYLWNKAFEVLEAAIASLTFFAQPIAGVALGILLLAEQVTPNFLLGSALIGWGVFWAATNGSGKEGVKHANTR